MIRLSFIALFLWALPGAAKAQSFHFQNFDSITELNLVYSSGNPSQVLRIHELGHASNDNMGAAWYENPVEVFYGFETTFEFSIHGLGNSDGLAFVIQNDRNPGIGGEIGAYSIGRHRAAMGYGRFKLDHPHISIENALVFELDHYPNTITPTYDPILDPDDNHISIHTGGVGETRQQESQSIGRATTQDLGFTNINNGDIHRVRISYVPGTLEVFFNRRLVISTPYHFSTGGTWIDSGLPVGGLDLIGGTSAYVGFTAASGGSRQNHDVISWHFASGPAHPRVKFCSPGQLNSTGNRALLEGRHNPGNGSGVHLEVTGGVPGQLAYMLVGNEATQGMAIGDGTFCLLGTLTARFYRYNRSGTNMNSIGGFDGSGMMFNSAGTSTTDYGFDVPNTIPDSVPITITAGDTWHFQAWYRDTASGAGTSNFTNGLSVTF